MKFIITIRMTLSHLRPFSYADKFKMSYGNVLIFTGHFINSSNKNLVGKNLYIPQTLKHPALTFKITRFSWSSKNDIDAIVIDFPNNEEREIVVNCDFTDEIFYVDL